MTRFWRGRGTKTFLLQNKKNVRGGEWKPPAPPAPRVFFTYIVTPLSVSMPYLFTFSKYWILVLTTVWVTFKFSQFFFSDLSGTSDLVLRLKQRMIESHSGDDKKGRERVSFSFALVSKMAPGRSSCSFLTFCLLYVNRQLPRIIQIGHLVLSKSFFVL